jgi:hypothetical protein
LHTVALSDCGKSRGNMAISFANVLCHFGERLVMLDLAREVIIPAITDGTLRRRYGQTQYFFHGTHLYGVSANGENGENVPVLAVYGRLVKDTVLTRTQVYAPDQGALVQNTESIASAPSAFFVIILNNHKLIYLPETPYAPPVQAFGSTLQYFARLKHKDYIDALYNQLRTTEAPRSKQSLYIEIPPPRVEVMPLASRGSIAEFLSAFEKLKHLEFRIIDTNQELQMRETYQQLRAMKHAVRSQNTRLIHDSAEGLDKIEAIDQINAAAATGNQEVKLSGETPDGTKLSGDNHKLKLQIPSDDLPENPAQRAERMIGLYEQQVEHSSAGHPSDRSAKNPSVAR